MSMANMIPVLVCRLWSHIARSVCSGKRSWVCYSSSFKYMRSFGCSAMSSIQKSEWDMTTICRCRLVWWRKDHFHSPLRFPRFFPLFYFSSWREYWRWTLVFILDVHNLIKDSGGSNTGGDTAFHTVCVILLPIVSFLLYEFISRFVYADRIAGSIHEDKHFISYLTFQKWSLFYAEQLYIPTILVWFRVWTCDSQGNLLYIYRNWACWSEGHDITIIVISAVSLFFMFAMPLTMYRRMKKILVFHDVATHERVGLNTAESESRESSFDSVYYSRSVWPLLSFSFLSVSSIARVGVYHGL